MPWPAGPRSSCSTYFASATAICAKSRFSARRQILESLLERKTTSRLRLSEQVEGDGRALYQRALASGWEGLIAKHKSSK